MVLILTPHLNCLWTVLITAACLMQRRQVNDNCGPNKRSVAVPAFTVRWASVLNTAVQFHAPKKSRAPMFPRLIDRWHRWGETRCRRWTLMALPQPQLSCQLPLTHHCQLWPWCSRPVKENSPRLHFKLVVSLCVAVSSHAVPLIYFLVRWLTSQADRSTAPAVHSANCPQSKEEI